MKKFVGGISVEAEGTVREEHSKALSHIQLRLKIQAKDLTDEEVRTALKTTEDIKCPVWSMMKGM
jgi:uncharacterized OsmC-like protein